MFVALPKTDVARVLGKQALRSGTSVGANYREASRARSKAEFISKTGDAFERLTKRYIGWNFLWIAVRLNRRKWLHCLPKPMN